VDAVTRTLLVDPLPEAAFNWSASWLTVTFTNASQHALTFTWVFGDGAFSTQTNPVHTYDQAGTYSVTLVAFGLCGEDSTQQAVTVLRPRWLIYLPIVFASNGL
jgi:PKD repeat protein